MRFLRLTYLVIILSLIANMTNAQTAFLDYGNHEINITVQSNSDMAYVVPVKAGDRLTVKLEVQTGGNVDFFLTNYTAYTLYRAGISGEINIQALYYLSDQSSLDSSGINYTYDSIANNELVVIIDNTANTEVGAAPTGAVAITGEIMVEQNVWTLQNIIITIFVVIALILFMAYLRFPRRKG